MRPMNMKNATSKTQLLLALVVVLEGLGDAADGAGLVIPLDDRAVRRVVRQSPAGGRWLGRARGCTRHSPGGWPQGQDSAYQFHGERGDPSLSNLLNHI